MTTDTKTGEGGGFDVTGMAKAWKEGYLKGLEASLQWQERNECGSWSVSEVCACVQQEGDGYVKASLNGDTHKGALLSGLRPHARPLCAIL